MLKQGQIVRIDNVPTGPDNQLRLIKAGDKAVVITDPEVGNNSGTSIRVISGSAAGYEYYCFTPRLTPISDSALERLKKLINEGYLTSPETDK